jgi:hypothetical protein
VRSPWTGPSPFAQCTPAAAQALRHSRRPGGFRVHRRVDHRVGPVEVSRQPSGPRPHPAGQADALVPGRVRRHHLCGQRQVVPLCAPDVRAEPAPPGGNPACSAGAAVVIPGRFRCAANNPLRNPTVASAAELADSGPGGASKNPRLRWRRGLPGSARAADADARSQTAAASARHCNRQTAIDPVENLAHADYGTCAKATAVAAGFQPPHISGPVARTCAGALCIQDIRSI